MPQIKLFSDEMRYLSLFESVTGAQARDCIIDSEWGRILFVVKEGQMGLAIGKSGSNVKRLTKLLGKNVEVVEYADEPETLIRNSLLPAKVHAVKIVKSPGKGAIAFVTVSPSEKKIAIGKDGSRIARARILAKRYFDIDNVIIG
ncbi:MAG: NusA-like transcription termination signal-binding factor [Candidatus Nezhaarchaeota archaeon]|nr:NusA-like transcription termination signal-binding factor [Candidatus Nezhaarchaeota archaeon]